MTIDDCFEVGRIIKLVGLYGEIKVQLTVEDSSHYNDIKSIYCYIDGSFYPLAIKKWVLSSKKNQTYCNAKFDGIETQLEADNIKGATLYLPLDSLPILDKHSFYYHEIIGFKVIDKNLGELGYIKEIFEITGNDLFSMIYKDNEVLVPLCKEITYDCDKKNKIVYVTLPDGLLDLGSR